MSRNVFANGKGISAKKDDNKSMCAMPDVCLSPPSPPAGPVPIPYPNTAQASDTSNGSKTVKIGGAEVGLKNSSNYKKSTGDEAATKSLGMGVVSHNIQGKMKHAAWSFDVKIEGANVIRHMDLTTHNHINSDNLVMTLNQEAELLARSRELTCDELEAANREARQDEVPPARQGNGTLTTASRWGNFGPPRGVGGEFQKSMCPNTPRARFADGYQSSLPEASSQPNCSGQGGQPPRRAGSGRVNDAENKLLVPAMNSAPIPGTQSRGMIRMSTWHPPGDAMPCYSCRQSICEAERCGVAVYLCRTERPPDEVRPADNPPGLCTPPNPQAGQGDYDPAWQAQGLGNWPP